MTRAKAAGLALTVQEVLHSTTLRDLAASATGEVDRPGSTEEALDGRFDLRPIQMLYAKMMMTETVGIRANHAQWSNHFNQSFLLQTTTYIRAHALSRAVHAIVSRHSMLRARFHTVEGQDSHLVQRISANVGESYGYDVHRIARREEAVSLIASRQASLDIFNGPVFAVDLLNVDDDQQLVFVVASRLIIDLMSWRIVLRDLEQLLSSETPLASQSFSFQSWCASEENRPKDFFLLSALHQFLCPLIPNFGVQMVPKIPTVLRYLRASR